MPRPPRLNFPGSFVHVHNRGVEKRDIFLDDDDRSFFLKLFGEVCQQYRWRTHGFTEMTNHYHLFVETIEATLSAGMQTLDGEYASYFNRRHDRVGHLFQDRFRSHLVDSREYLLTVARYIVLNPVRARMVETPGAWRWSSYRATAGLETPPPWLETRLILDHFDEWDGATAHALYREFVASAIGQDSSPWENLVAGIFLGGRAFIENLEEMLSTQERKAHHSTAPYRVRARSVEEVAAMVTSSCAVGLIPKRWSNESARLAFVLLARTLTTGPVTAMAERLQVSPSGIRLLLKRAERRAASEVSFQELINRLRIDLSCATILDGNSE